MSELVKNLGVIVLLIGVIILAVPAITGVTSVTLLSTRRWSNTHKLQKIKKGSFLIIETIPF